MKIEMIQKKLSIDEYFESMGIKACHSRNGFWKHAANVDSSLAEKLEPLFTRKMKGNIYELKNQSLPFSLAVESWTMSFHLAFLNWVNGQEKLKPKRILEIGCDNGLLACWYATHFPDAEIVGIDREANSIHCAKQLAMQLEVDNVRFLQMDFSELKQGFSSNSFDLIISVRTFHEIMGPILISRYWSLTEYLKGNPTYGDRKYLQIVDHLLSEDGTYLSCERLENPADLGKWANALHEANLNVGWDESEIIEYQELGIHKRSPIILATKSKAGRATLDGIEHLCMKHQDVVLEAGNSYSGVAAEFAFHRLGKKKFHTGQYLDVTNHWHEYRFEIWETMNFLLVYCYGNMGHRQLEILPGGAFSEARLLLQESMKLFHHLGSIVHYKSMEECQE
ncbi:class I SAM-dependent methyltransferase [Neobacillus muris]|uniref:class I SAM-dependent methyltransferase n=1 Tax=Neobacillus muris TaxID=2941334 RepID=UPI00203D1704|nr:class I SAM-dependent methyltransferase [Neobacillus muris]